MFVFVFVFVFVRVRVRVLDHPHILVSTRNGNSGTFELIRELGVTVGGIASRIRKDSAVNRSAHW